MIKEKRILVFSACYNEKENIKKLILKIREYLPFSSILIIDDNSPDNTSDVIKKLQKNDSRLDLIKRDKKLGTSQGIKPNIVRIPRGSGADKS